MGLSSRKAEFPHLTHLLASYFIMFHNEKKKKRPSQSLSLRSMKEPIFFSAQVAHNVADKLSEKIDFIMVKASAWHPSIINKAIFQKS